MAVKTYSLKKNGETYLSEHFQVKEFASIGQGKTYSDKVLIDTALVSLLEKVHKHFNCKAIVISSGYRTSEHDIAVGGSGSGYHVKGQAADFCCYDKSGKEIESSKVVLYLEDIGCNGIGYKCGGSSVYTHADTRAASARWYGDESRDFLDISQLGGYKSFYNYLGVKKSANTSTSTSSAAKTMKISTDGVNFIKSFEGLSLKACKALPTEEYYTIGYGHYGADVKAGQTITETGAVKLLKKDLESFVSCVNKALTVKVTQKQFDALVSLCYNIGVGAFASSDLVTYLNKGKLYDAAAEITLWRKSGGSVIIGLQNRRIKEFRLFLTGKSLTLLCDMNVRAKPMTSSKRVKVLKKGKKIKVVDVAVSYGEYINIWLQTADGWVCGQLNGEVYLK